MADAMMNWPARCAWAVHAADHHGKYGPGTGPAVLADPERNEFCVLRNSTERLEI